MKIVVIGATSLIGSKTVAILRQGGHEVVAASPNSGVNTITGGGLKEAVASAQVVIDLANSPSHRHPSSAFIYARVLEGAIRSKVNDAPERTYQAGESWTEQPGDHHELSQNASATAPAKLLAIFVVDTSDREIVIPDK
jgi:quercetin dioxygenase-like cupin family protein